MDFYIKVDPEYQQFFTVGALMVVDLGGKKLEVTITKIEGEKVAIQANDDEGKQHLEALMEDKVREMSMEGKQ